MWITCSRFYCRTSSHSHELNVTDGHFHLIVAIIFILSNNPKCLFFMRLYRLICNHLQLVYYVSVVYIQ